MQAEPVTHCLACASSRLHGILDLGEQPLANNLLTEADLDQPEPRFPLGIQVCQDCWLVQLTVLVPPVDLFSSYLYFSSFSETMLRHAAAAADRFIEQLALGAESFVVEIASNDGYLLKNFAAKGIPCLGIEPAENIAEIARASGVETITEFFGKTCAEGLRVERGQADLILGNNVFAHVPDVNGFVSSLGHLLAPGGTACIEFPYGREMFDHTEFDTIYHEHVFYFTLTPLVPLLARHGLEIYDLERLSIHGGSLRLWIGHEGSHEATATVAELLADERESGICDLAYYETLAGRVAELRADLLAAFHSILGQGGTIAAYGASAKGSTLLNYCAPPTGSIQFIADRSDWKHGRFSPGLHLPIAPASELERRQPDYTLLLTWNFADEILEQQSSYRRKGGRFIIPIPKTRFE